MEGKDLPRKPRVLDENDPMTILARVALEEQAEKAMERQNKKRAQEAALAQNEAQEKDAARKLAQFQAVCDHLLGNHRIGVIPDVRRCALHRHTFSDKTVVLRCHKCRAVWKPGDSATFLLRTEGYPPRPIKVPNPTKKGWKAINDFFYSFGNAKELTSICFRMERVEPERIEEDADEPVLA